MQARAPIVFQIGFNLCGTETIAELFRGNGHEARVWGGGALAEDIFHARATGRPPLEDWPTARLFCDLESVHRFDRPMLEAFKAFRYLEAEVPNALFILNVGDPDAWTVRRAHHKDGQYLKLHAHHLGLPESEVPHHWRRDWDRHVAHVLAHFEGSDRLIHFDSDADRVETLAERLANWFDFKQMPDSPGKRPSPDDNERFDVLCRRLETEALSSGQRPPGPDKRFVETVARHCIARAPEEGESLDRGRHSALHAVWNGRERVLRCDGSQWPMVRIAGWQADHFLARPRVPKLDRLQGVLNEILSLHRSRPMEIDMQDGRGLGTDGMRAPDGPVLTYNRRRGVANLVLWPLPGYHTIGERHFAQPETPDPVPFGQKEDKLVWRGNLAGRALPGRFPGQEHRRPSHHILKALLLAQRGSAAEAALEAELLQLTRFEFVSRFFDHPGFDIGFTLPERFRQLESVSLLARYCVKREPLAWTYGYRYVASLSGHDTGSNFFAAANSNSVVLKEEDGWELFYTNAFRPWQHYIPLEPGAGDVEDKLAWARDNPARCIEMITASQTMCARFASVKYRREILNLILDTL